MEQELSKGGGFLILFGILLFMSITMYFIHFGYSNSAKHSLEQKLEPTVENFSKNLQNSILDVSYDEGVRRSTIDNLEIGRNGDSYLSVLSALDEDTFEKFVEEFNKNRDLHEAVERSYKDGERKDVEKFFTSYVKILNEKFDKNITPDDVMRWIFLVSTIKDGEVRELI